jgi:hypothetical protein
MSHRTILMIGLFTLAASIAGVACGAAAPADDPPPKKDPPKPWRPYKDIPDALYFESFENETPGAWTSGSINDKVVQAPGTHSLKLVSVNDKDQNDEAVANLAILGTFKLMGGLKSSDVKVQYMIWADNPGKATTSFMDDKNNWYSHVMNINKGQTWTPVTLDLAECNSGHAALRENVVVTQLKTVFTPQHAKTSTAYIDEFIITNTSKPPDVLPLVLAVEAKRNDLLRTAPRDGFSFNYLSQETLQSFTKSARRKKSRTVLVMCSRPETADAFKSALAAAETKLRGPDFHFVFAESPDGTPAAGLDDMHTLLPYNLQKSEAEIALLLVGSSDVADGSPPGSETIRVVQERALESGCVPMVCTSPGNITAVAKDRTNLDRLYSAVITASKQTGSPYIDIGYAYKDNAAALDKGELSAIGVQNLAEVAVKALKHVDAFVFGRK